MELIIHSVKEEQVALFEELAKVLGLQLEKKDGAISSERIQGAETSTPELKEANWNEVVKNADEDI